MNKLRPLIQSSGFSLLELTLALMLTSTLSFLLVANYFSILRGVSLSANTMDTALKHQQLTYFFQQMLSSAGQYNIFDVRNKITDDNEQKLLLASPIVLPGSYGKKPKLGVKDAKNDTLAVNLMSDLGCNGRHFDYKKGEFFHLVNEVFVEANTLKCRSYDGRFLTGLKSLGARWSSVSLLNGVQQMQVYYLVKLGKTSRYLNASQLQHAHKVVAVKIKLILNNTDDVLASINSSLAVLVGEQNKQKGGVSFNHLQMLLPVSIGGANVLSQ